MHLENYDISQSFFRKCMREKLPAHGALGLAIHISGGDR